MAESRSLGGIYVEVISKGIQQVEEELLRMKKALKDADEGTEKVKDSFNKLDSVNSVFGKITSSVGTVGTAASKTTQTLGTMFSPLLAGIQQSITHLQQLTNVLSNVGSVATRVFLGASAAITGFVKTADPQGFQRLQGTLAQISVQIGSIFLPILDKTQKMLEGFLNFLRSLDNEQKSQIARWVQVAGAIALGLAVLPRVISLVSIATGAIKLLGTTLAVATGGILPLLATLTAVGAGFALFQSSTEKGTSGIMSALNPLIKVFGDLKNAFLPLGASLKPIMESLAGTFTDVVSGIAQAVSTLVPVVVTVFQALIKAVAPVVDAIRPLVSVFMKLVNEVVSTLAPLISKVAPILIAVGNLITAQITMWTGAFKALVPAIKPIMSAFTAILDSVLPLVESVIDTLTQVLESLTPVVAVVFTAISQSVATGVNVFKALLATAQPAIDLIIDLVNMLGDVFATTFESVSVLFDGLMVDMGDLSAIWEGVVETIKSTVAGLKPLFETVFSAITFTITSVIKTLIYLSTLLKEISKGNFSGAVSSAADAVNEFDRRLDEKQAAREGRKKDRTASTEETTTTPEKPQQPEKPKPETDNRHAGQLLQKVELIGFADMWKKAMQATIETPESKMQQEVINTQKEGNQDRKRMVKLLEEIKDKDEGKTGTYFED
jgi:phage-related protein